MLSTIPLPSSSSIRFRSAWLRRSFGRLAFPAASSSACIPASQMSGGIFPGRESSGGSSLMARFYTARVVVAKGKPTFR
jgi:hypothetical protein